MTVPELYSRVVELYRDARRASFRRPRWVLSRAHVQAFHDRLDEERRVERQRLAGIVLPGFDPTEHLRRLQPLPPPDYDKVDEIQIQLMGWPVRIADVAEIEVEDMSPDVLIENWRRWSAARDTLAAVEVGIEAHAHDWERMVHRLPCDCPQCAHVTRSVVCDGCLAKVDEDAQEFAALWEVAQWP
jgi:hypothetical protein